MTKMIAMITTTPNNAMTVIPTASRYPSNGSAACPGWPAVSSASVLREASRDQISQRAAGVPMVAR